MINYILFILSFVFDFIQIILSHLYIPIFKIYTRNKIVGSKKFNKINYYKIKKD